MTSPASPMRAARGLAGLLALLAASAQAGPSLDEALQRQREAVRAGTRPTPLRPPDDAPVLRTSVAGGEPASQPALLGTPLDGGTGVQWRGLQHFADDGVWRFRLGLAWRDERTLGAGSFEGSVLARSFAAGELYASVQRRHWGPSWTGSLILDGAAPALPALGWRRADAAGSHSRWLAWLGPWNADIFMARLSQQQPRGPLLAGLRLQAMPWPGLEVGASRTIQWGGEGRPRSPRALIDALLGRDNKGDSGIGLTNEPGNQLAGIDLRQSIALGGGARLRIYGQAVGEDEAGHWPSKYLRSIGLDLLWPHAGGSLLAFAEGADTQAGDLLGAAYRHHLYPEGYTQRGRPLGHPAGGDRRLVSAGLQAEQGPAGLALRLHRGRALDGAQAELRGVDLAAAWQLSPEARLGASWVRWRDADAVQRRAQLWWQLRL